MPEIRPVFSYISQSKEDGRWWIERRFMAEGDYDPDYIHRLAGPFETYETAVSAANQLAEYKRGSWLRLGGTPPVDIRPLIDFAARAAQRWANAAPRTPEQLNKAKRCSR